MKLFNIQSIHMSNGRNFQIYFPPPSRIFSQHEIIGIRKILEIGKMGLDFQQRRIKAQLSAVVHHRRRDCYYSYYYYNPTGKSE